VEVLHHLDFYNTISKPVKLLTWHFILIMFMARFLVRLEMHIFCLPLPGCTSALAVTVSLIPHSTPDPLERNTPYFKKEKISVSRENS